MLARVGDGYARRMSFLRKAWGTQASPRFRGPGPADLEACERHLRDGSPEGAPLGLAALSALPGVRVSMFARILGRDYARSGGEAFEAVIRTGGAAGLSPERQDEGWLLVGQAILDASLGIRPGDAMESAPALPREGVGDEDWVPFSGLSRHLDSLLRLTATDRAGLLAMLGLTEEHARLVVAADCHWTEGSFLAGLIEGLGGTDWEDACLAAERRHGGAPSIEIRAYPMAVAAHLALQAGVLGKGFELPGFGVIEPRGSARH